MVGTKSSTMRNSHYNRGIEKITFLGNKWILCAFTTCYGYNTFILSMTCSSSNFDEINALFTRIKPQYRELALCKNWV